MPSDPRMLVPLDKVPETWPAGLPVRCSYGRAAAAVAVIGTPSRRDAFTDGVNVYLHGDTRGPGCWPASHTSIDLTAPPTDEHGDPTRLDALGWALGVLWCRAWGDGRPPAMPAATTRHRNGRRWMEICDGAGLVVVIHDGAAPGQPVYRDTTGHLSGNEPALVLLDWPETRGEWWEDKIRLIVAAALRAGVGLEDSDGR